MLNAIEPIKLNSKEFDGTVRLIYHTTPHRGLDILYLVFNHIYNNITKNIHLDVFSSFGVYGWKERDEPFKELFKALDAHPAITYHGSKSNDDVREALVHSHIFAYPCVWPETSCIAAIEAMSAANLIVCPNFAALPETTAKLAMMYDMHEDRNVIANTFANKLLAAINLVASQSSKYSDEIAFQKLYCDKNYDWNKRIRQWDEFLRMEHFY
jgi:glycosyltransferase involved in cell wall biosynthesis